MRISDWSSDVCSSDLLDRAFRGQERVIGHNLHLEAERAIGNDRTNIVRADEAQRLGRQLNAHEAILFPLARLRQRVGLRHLARESDNQGHGVLGRGDTVDEGGGLDTVTLGRSGGDCDIFHTYYDAHVSLTYVPGAK